MKKLLLFLLVIFSMELLFFMMSGCQPVKKNIQVHTDKQLDSRPEPKTRLLTEEEKHVFIEKLIKENMRLTDELESNLVKLDEDKDRGMTDLKDTEIDYIKKQLTASINFEREEIESFRGDLQQVDFNMTIIGKDIYYGVARAGKIIVQQRIGDNIIIFDVWTGKPKKEIVFEDHKVKKINRFDKKGKKYLYAKYAYNNRGSLQYIVILNRNETAIWMIDKSNLPSKMKTRVGKDKWVEWPIDMKWGRERIKFITFD